MSKLGGDEFAFNPSGQDVAAAKSGRTEQEEGDDHGDTSKAVGKHRVTPSKKCVDGTQDDESVESTGSTKRGIKGPPTSLHKPSNKKARVLFRKSK